VLTLQKCRSLLGTDCKLTDAELEQLRHELYIVAEVAISDFCVTRKAGAPNGSEPQSVSASFRQIPPEERAAVEERAAILEFEAHLKKPEAERQAFGEWVQSKKGSGDEPRKRFCKRNPKTPRKPKRPKAH
jgi:hypothetical protein